MAELWILAQVRLMSDSWLFSEPRSGGRGLMPTAVPL